MHMLKEVKIIEKAEWLFAIFLFKETHISENNKGSEMKQLFILFSFLNKKRL